MIKIHLQHIPENDSLRFTGEADPAVLDLGEAEAEAIGPLFYDLEVGLSGDGLFATGHLSQKVRMTCVACLEPFEYQIDTREFAMQRDLQGSELVDLTPEVREDIHLLLPMHPRCDMGGNKKCSAQFPKSDIYSKESSDSGSIEPCPQETSSKETSSVWAALDNIIKH